MHLKNMLIFLGLLLGYVGAIFSLQVNSSPLNASLLAGGLTIEREGKTTYGVSSAPSSSPTDPAGPFRAIRGWSSWNSFLLKVNETVIQKAADTLSSLGLASVGYNYVLIDDGWMSCAEYEEGSSGRCRLPGARDAQGRLVPDHTRFPSGMKALAASLHEKGMKIGIYTAVSKTTCGGFPASLGYEAVDAATFASWGMDFVKFDTCNEDCGVHDGCMQASVKAMHDGIEASGRNMFFYLDAGNPSSPPRLYNPKGYHIKEQDIIKVGRKPEELVWHWAKELTNMRKHWFDISDNWMSTLDNLHHMIGTEMYQTCGSFNTPDMLTMGLGGMTAEEYRSQFLLWALLGGPLILSFDITAIPRALDDSQLSLLTNKEILSIQADSDCIQASRVRAQESGEVWIKPLSDGSFAAVLLNKHNDKAQEVSLWLQYEGWCDGQSCNGGDFYPASFYSAHIRDVVQGEDIGTVKNVYRTVLKPHAAVMLRIIPDNSRSPKTRFSELAVEE